MKGESLNIIEWKVIPREKTLMMCEADVLIKWMEDVLIKWYHQETWYHFNIIIEIKVLSKVLLSPRWSILFLGRRKMSLRVNQLSGQMNPSSESAWITWLSALSLSLLWIIIPVLSSGVVYTNAICNRVFNCKPYCINENIFIFWIFMSNEEVYLYLLWTLVQESIQIKKGRLPEQQILDRREDTTWTNSIQLWSI